MRAPTRGSLLAAAGAAALVAAPLPAAGIHECFPPASVLAAESGLSIERATIALNAAHTSPKAAGKVFRLAKPRMAGLWHTPLSPKVIPQVSAELEAVYDGPVVQTQDFTVFNVSKESIVARQAKVLDQVVPVPGTPGVAFQPTEVPPPARWKEALRPADQDRAPRGRRPCPGAHPRDPRGSAAAPRGHRGAVRRLPGRARGAAPRHGAGSVPLEIPSRPPRCSRPCAIIGSAALRRCGPAGDDAPEPK